jgi:hypothetical protein
MARTPPGNLARSLLSPGLLCPRAMAATVERLRRVGWVLPGLLASGFCLAAYLRTLKPGLDYHDFGEMQVTAKLLGVTHTTGYPVYIWLAWLFDFLPIRDPAYRTNLFSAVAGAISVFLVFVVITRLTPRTSVSALAAAAAAVAFGLSYNQWAISIFAEVYSLHVALAMTVVWLALRWEQEDRDLFLALAFFVSGAMFGNHLCALSVVPPLGLFLLVVRPGRLNLRRLAVGGVSFFSGLLLGSVVLLWLLWRRHAPWDMYHASILANPDLFPYPGGKDEFWSCWWFNLSALQFRYTMSPDANWTLTQAKVLPHRLVAELFPLGALGAVFGMALLFRRRWQSALLISGIYLTQTALILHYYSWKIPYYYVAPHACMSVGLGVGLAWLGARLDDLIARSWRRSDALARQGATIAAFVALLGLGGLVDAALARPYDHWLARIDPKSEELVRWSLGSRPDESGDNHARPEARRLMETIPDGALVLADWSILWPLVYVARVEGLRPNVDFQEAYPAPRGRPFSERKHAFLKQQMSVRPVFLVGDPADAKGPYEIAPVAQGVWRLR